MNFPKDNNGLSLNEELIALRRSTRDIVAISALPSVWIHLNPSQVADSLAETLSRCLKSEFVYVMFSNGDAQIESIYGKNGSITLTKDLSTAFGSFIETGSVSPALKEVSGEGSAQYSVTPVGPTLKNGAVVVGSIQSSFPNESDRLILNIASNLANVTIQRKWTLLKLESLYAQAEEREQVLRNEREIRERFVNTLTHDLRTPLTAAKMSAQLLGRDKINPDKKITLQVRIVDNLNRANQMIENLLDANSMNAGKALTVEKSEQDLYSLINNTLFDLVTLHGDRFVLTSKEKSIKGFWSVDAIQRIMENLCGNAVKYGDSRTPINIKLSTTNTHVTISVHNMGNPIPQNEQIKLFNPFQRLESSDKTVKGWGLGLTLVKGLVEAHGGTISVTSSIEDGTTFSILLPYK